MKVSWGIFLTYVSVLIMFGCSMGQPVRVTDTINGVSLVNPRSLIEKDMMASVKRVNSDWVAVIPFGFSHQNEPLVHFNHERQWWGERVDGTAELVKMANENGLKVMMKPHVWMRSGWIGDYDLDSESKWKEWENSYEDYILTYAKLSDSLGVPLLCIGTEYKIATTKRPVYWKSLIGKIREVYSGQLTYAANWDNYHNISFWSELDFIGVDAYFPLIDELDPDSHIIESAWVPIREELKKISLEKKRPILFTEFGYQSVNGTTGKHWEVSKNEENLNMLLQARAYDCMFKMFWNKEWCAGGFLWKWHLQSDAGGECNPHFTPQGKPVEAVIKSWYAKN
ncbi:MAG: hypothetical protein ACJA08_000126 [Cyclobacteriaceae bacterium]|jgi:hypothetical protein